MALMDSLKSMFGKKSDSVLGIDIGSSAIKVIQLRRKKGKAVLETYGELALGPYAGTEIGRATNLSADKLAEALTDIIREANVNTNQAGVSMPVTSSLIAFITVPKVDDRQMGEVIAIEARKYIPVPMNEVLLDWSIIPKENSLETDIPPEEAQRGAQGSVPGSTPVATQGNTLGAVPVAPRQTADVLVVAIHNEAVSVYQNVVNKVNLNASFFEIELFSSVRAVVDQGIQAHMILDMGARTTKLYIVERGLLRTSHVINRGSQDITLAISKAMSISVDESENLKRLYGLDGGLEHKDIAEIISLTLDYIFYEANRVLLNFQRQYNKNIVSVILTGGGVLLRGFPDLAKASFQTDVVYADPFGKLETPAVLTTQLRVAGPEFAVAIGIAMRRLNELV